MERFKKMEERDHTTLVRILFGLGSPTPVQHDFEKTEFFDEALNDSQRDAIRFALGSREVALIHGPPGVSQPHQRSNMQELKQIRQAKHTLS